MPSAIPCGNSTFTNLAQYTSTTTTGVFIGSGVTNSGGQYHFNASGTLTTGNYPVGFSYTTSSGCAVTAWQNVYIMNSLSLTTNTPGSYCANLGNSATISATYNPPVSGVTYSWSPGNLTSLSNVVSPSVSLIYTISASAGSCSANQTLAVTTLTNCCPSSTISAFSGTTLTSGLSSAKRFTTDVLVPPGNNITLTSSEFLFAPGSKLIISNNATLNIVGSHLYACANSMWQGIVVQDGGKIRLSASFSPDQDNLIEDAIIGIDLSNQYTTTQSPVLEVENTTFNKNYIGINISNYTTTLTTYPFKISNCVFTCRNLPFTSTLWPFVGVTSSANSVAADLRYAASGATTGLSPPYLNQGFSIVNLKPPHSGQPSHIGIKLANVGVTTGTNYVYYGIVIGSTNTAVDYNLFDAHGTAISAVNSNVTSHNVFQNTQRYLAPSPTNTSVNTVQGGIGIETKFTGLMNGKLDCKGGTLANGNRFWNCHEGISASKLFRLEIDHAIFRSTQTNTNSLVLFGQVGSSGINIATNKFLYRIHDNEFTNINACINVALSAASFTTGSVPVCSVCLIPSGICAGALTVLTNTFSSGVNGSFPNAYLGRAINISCANSSAFYIEPSYSNYLSEISVYNSIPWTLPGTLIYRNKMNNVWRGININGFTNAATAVKENTISLSIDNISGQPQYAISQTNCMAANNTFERFSITENSLSAQSYTDATTNMVFSGNNLGIYAPKITCNEVINAHNGFEFNSQNTPTVTLPGAQWRANEMQTLANGLVLSGNGIMGVQGGSLTVSNNHWNGGWSSPTKNGTFVDQLSDAQFSPLWSVNYPPSNYGYTATPTQWYGFANNTYTSSGGSYQCYEPDNYISPYSGSNVDYYNAAAEYIHQTGLYRFLYNNDSIKNSTTDLSDFYDDFTNSNIDYFNRVEQKLIDGDISGALAINSTIVPVSSHAVEENYKLFYNLLATWQSGGLASLSVADSTDLANLSFLCPAFNGACIYQARGLYNSIYKMEMIYPSCDGSGTRIGQFGQEQLGIIRNDSTWNIVLYPNPSTGKFNLVSNVKSESLSITITDISGRIIQSKSILTSEYREVFYLEIDAGLYFVSISNSKNESVVKKIHLVK